jgi:IS4 transposase
MRYGIHGFFLSAVRLRDSWETTLTRGWFGMSEFTGRFGDKRRAAVLSQLEEAMVAQSSVVVRRLGGDRAGEISAHRALSAPEVTVAAIVDGQAYRTARAATGRRIVVAQDTTEVNFPGRLRNRLGRAGRTGATAGFFIHAAVAIDADDEAVLGLVDAMIWTREAGAVTDRRKRQLEEKESRRWLMVSELAGVRLAGARERIVVGDRESDIYALFDGHPPDTDLVVRVAQNRKLADGGELFEAAREWPVLGRQAVKVASRGPGDAGRIATVELRAGRVALRQPRHGKREGSAASLTLALVEAMETAPPDGAAALHWRLLTTLPGSDLAAATDVVRLYRLRWRIEQGFRMLKSDGLKLEEAQTADPHRLFNLAALAMGAAVRIVQLVDARDGSNRPAADVASDSEIAAAAALCPTLEGKTARQRNPHPPASLAWLSWVVARLGGWNCYYKPPGPKTMRQGWDRFAAIAAGFALANTPQNP